MKRLDIAAFLARVHNIVRDMAISCCGSLKNSGDINIMTNIKRTMAQ